MKINQLTSEEISKLQDKARELRSQIPNADYLNALELSYQATRIETWVQIQKGNNDQLKAKLESLPDNCDPRTGLPPKKNKPTLVNEKRRYHMVFQERGPRESLQAIERINQRSQDLKKMPQRIKFR